MRLLCGIALLGAAAVTAPAPAPASTVVYTLNECYGNGGSCPNSGPYGTVTVSSLTTGGVSVTLSLPSNETYTISGAGADQALLFDLPVSPLQVTNLTSGFSLHSVNSGSLHADGSGTWDYGIMCNSCSSGNSGMGNTPISFDIPLASVTPLSFQLDTANGTSPAAYFATDIAISGTSFTGDVGSTNATTVPLPPTLLLLASALTALVWLGRRSGPRIAYA